MPPVEAMHRIDSLLSHVWMVRTFLKHSDEAADNPEVAEVHRELHALRNGFGIFAVHMEDRRLQHLRDISRIHA